MTIYKKLKAQYMRLRFTKTVIGYLQRISENKIKLK